jgi:hypothetical protein
MFPKTITKIVLLVVLVVLLLSAAVSVFAVPEAPFSACNGLKYAHQNVPQGTPGEAIVTQLSSTCFK